MTTESWPIRTFGTRHEVIRAVIIVVLVAAVIGGATSPGQQYLPDAIRSLANAVGPWFVAIQLAVYAGRSRLGLAAILGVVGFVLLNVSYAVVSESRGFAYSAGSATSGLFWRFPLESSWALPRRGSVRLA